MVFFEPASSRSFHVHPPVPAENGSARPRVRHSVGWLFASVAATFALAGCYASGQGTDPPPKSIYFPVGLVVSKGNNVLYVANSDLDLKYRGGTLQSYDLYRLRRDVIRAIDNPSDPRLPFAAGYGPVPAGSCPNGAPIYDTTGRGTRQRLGETCAPATDATVYVRDSVTLGAFTTDMQMSVTFDRLFAPVRGDASLTWADVVPDDPAAVPGEDAASFPPFTIDCGARVDNRCEASHVTGNRPDAAGNVRNVTMPGEPFGMAQSTDGSLIAITHQNDTKVSLLTSGVPVGGSERSVPAIVAVLDGVPYGGNGIVAVPHPASGTCAPGCASFPPAFLETSRSVPQISLLRYYPGESNGSVAALERPYLLRERAYPLVNSAGADARGIAIDTSPRLRCLANGGVDAVRCDLLPSRVFIAGRIPAAVLVGEVGGIGASVSDTYDPDKLVLSGQVPVGAGPSRVTLAPVVDASGHYALRLFVVCSDANEVDIINPDTLQVESIIHVGALPYSLGFDAFDPTQAALGAEVPVDTRPELSSVKRYRFAYVASFTNSFVQVVDLDASDAVRQTFGTVVYTLGLPTTPTGG